MAKHGILQMKIEGILQDVWPQTDAAQVIVDETTQETLATRLATLASDISDAVAGGLTTSQVQEMIDAEIDALIDGAPETYNTLKEIATYISEHQEVVDSLNAAIGDKVDKEEGKGLSANDFTDALLAKLNGIAEGATKVEKSDTNGNIKVDGVETVVYTHPTGNGNEHLPADGTVGQVLRAAGNGTATWGENVRSGSEVPADLAEGELFIKIVG